MNEGTIVSDTGSSSGPLPRFIENEVKNFNADGELLGVATSTNAPLIPGVTRVVTHSRISGNTITFVPPGPFPGTGPPDDYTALRSLRVSGPRDRPRRPRLRPDAAELPRGRHVDRVDQPSSTSTACRRPWTPARRAGPPPARVTRD